MGKKKSFFRSAKAAVLAVALTGCAGLSRECSSCNAQSFGSDWVITRSNMEGQAYNCWRLTNTSVANEPHSDGIYWKDGATGNLVHISGWYDRVQVVNGQWEQAAKSLGVDLNKCENGMYVAGDKSQ